MPQQKLEKENDDETTEPEMSTPINKPTDLPSFVINTKDTGECNECKKMGPKPPPIQGKVWVRGWTLIDGPLSPVEKNKSFEELVLDKMKGPQEKKIAPRRKIDRKAKAITDQEYLDDLRMMEEEAKKKEEQIALRKRPQPTAMVTVNAKKKIKFNNDDEDKIGGATMFDETSESDDTSDSDSSGESDVEDDEIEEEEANGELERTDEETLLRLWKSLSPPIEEEDVLHK